MIFYDLFNGDVLLQSYASYKDAFEANKISCTQEHGSGNPNDYEIQKNGKVDVFDVNG